MTRPMFGLSKYLLPASRAGRTLALGSFVDSLGSGLFLAVSTLYFVGTVGIAPSFVALTLAVSGGLGLMAGTPAGKLADHLGVRRVYLSLLVARGLAYSLYILVDGVTGYLLITCLATVMDRGCSPLTQAAVRQVVGAEDRNRTMASIRALRNIGYTAGTLLAAAAMTLDSRWAMQLLFAANGTTFLVTAWCSHRALKDPRPIPSLAAPHVSTASDSAPEEEPGTLVRSPFRVPSFMMLTAGNALMCLHDSVLVVLLPVWVLRHESIPQASVPILLAVNTALTVVLQLWISSLAIDHTTSRRLLSAAAATLCSACAFFALVGYSSPTTGTAAMAGAVVLLTVGENLHAAASWYLSDALSPPVAYARYLGAFTTGVTAHGLFGPALVLSVILPLGTIGWPLLGTLFAVGAGGMSLGASYGHRTAPSQTPSTVPPTPLPDRTSTSKEATP